MRVLAGGNGGEIPEKITTLLRRSGLTIDLVDDIGDMLSLSRRQRFDLLLVHFGPSQRRTGEFIRALRRQGCTAPLLGVSAGVELAERIEALNSGADDCVSASIPAEELLARVTALLRRPPVSIGPTYSFGDITLDASVVVVTCGGERVAMPRREIKLLEVLLRAGSSPVSRERLEHAMFSFEDAVTPNALEAAISRLRRRLKIVGSAVTVMSNRGFGYVLKIERAAAASGRASVESMLAVEALVGSN